MHLQPGTLLQGRYRIAGLIASGGMGAVYRAADERLGNTVALKQTLMATPQLREAFEREARLLAGLHHPALPVVSDHFTEDGGQFLVMQFIPGDDLATMLQRRGAPFPFADLLPWADRLLDALDYLHSRTPPVIHRDIKPQNLKLTAHGELVLLDFGLAKGEPAGATAPSPSLFGYTPQYAPLEQIQGSGTDARSDLYAAAATLYELLTGVVPPDALSRAAAAVRGEADPLRPAHGLNPQIPPALSDLLGQALTLNPALRPPSAAAMRATLRGIARSQVGATVAATVAALPAAILPAAVSTTTIVERRSPTPGLEPAPPRPAPPSWRPFALLALLAMPFLALMVTLGTGGAGGPTTSAPATAAAPLDAPSGSADRAGTTRANPLPWQATVELPGWRVQLRQQIRGDAAYARLREANSTNGPPPDGMEYLLLQVRTTATGDAPASFSRGDLRLVGSRAVAYDGFAAVPPAPILGDDALAPGASAEAWAAYLIGVEERELVAAVGNLITGDVRFVALTPGTSLSPDPALAAIAPNRVGTDAREPAEVGATAITADWEVTVLEAFRGEWAWALIYEGNRYNDPPADGMEYIAARVWVRRLGPADKPAFITASYFTASRAGAEVEQRSVVPPKPNLAAMLFPGGVAEGWVAVQVPIGAADAMLTFQGNPVFFQPNDPNTRFFRVD